MIYIVNFPFCNFFSLERYLRVRVIPYEILSSSSVPVPDDFVVLPGVGTFLQGMAYLDKSSLKQVIKQHINDGGNLLGICLGMQILLNGSQENDGIEGLGVIPGECIRLPFNKDFMVPHIGWNSLILSNSSKSVLSSVFQSNRISNSDYYFVHSFYAKPFSPNSTTAYFDHPEGPITAVVEGHNTIGMQFHPEKSGKSGYSLLDKVFIR